MINVNKRTRNFILLYLRIIFADYSIYSTLLFIILKKRSNLKYAIERFLRYFIIFKTRALRSALIYQNLIFE